VGGWMARVGGWMARVDARVARVDARVACVDGGVDRWQGHVGGQRAHAMSRWRACVSQWQAHMPVAGQRAHASGWRPRMGCPRARLCGREAHVASIGPFAQAPAEAGPEHQPVVPLSHHPVWEPLYPFYLMFRPHLNQPSK